MSPVEKVGPSSTAVDACAPKKHRATSIAKVVFWYIFCPSIAMQYVNYRVLGDYIKCYHKLFLKKEALRPWFPLQDLRCISYF